MGQGYSNRTAVGTAVGDEPETLYAVFGGRYFNDMCCFGGSLSAPYHCCAESLDACA
eukprot:SAG31_NODE_3718_length_3951_cov_2.903686_5_plen_57_part_00